MRELTLEEKIAFCDMYLAINRHVIDYFICNQFTNWKLVKGLFDEVMYLESVPEIEKETEETFKCLFPELYEMIMRVGKERIHLVRPLLNPQPSSPVIFEFGQPWWVNGGEQRSFRKERIRELKETIIRNSKNKNHGNN
jgi:hypothetical protein